VQTCACIRTCTSSNAHPPLLARTLGALCMHARRRVSLFAKRRHVLPSSCVPANAGPSISLCIRRRDFETTSLFPPLHPRQGEKTKRTFQLCPSNSLACPGGISLGEVPLSLRDVSGKRRSQVNPPLQKRRTRGFFLLTNPSILDALTNYFVAFSRGGRSTIIPRCLLFSAKRAASHQAREKFFPRK